MSVTLTDEQAQQIHRALEHTVTLASFDVLEHEQLDQEQDDAYALICGVMGVTPRTVATAATS